MSTNLGDSNHELDAVPPVPCLTCGFDPDQVSAEQAMAELHALPTSWRATLAVHLDDPDPGAALATRPSAHGWTALEHAGHVRDVVHALDNRLQRVLREDDPTLPETPTTPPAGANEQGVAVVLAALTVSTDQMSGTIESTPDGAWARTGRRRGASVSALDLVREAVHEGRHHLALATRTLADVRATAASASAAGVS